MSPRGPLLASLALASAAVALLGCAKRDDLLDSDWTKETRAGQEPWREVESLFAASPRAGASKSATLPGVRLDLVMAPKAVPSVRCTCLDVVVGPATDRRLRWEGEIPELAPGQLAFAMRTEGASCPPSVPALRRPSIHAVDEVDGNTVVVVEELPEARPQALGAVLPLPRGAGSVFVRARSDPGHVAIYAQGPKGPSSMCRVETKTVVGVP